MNSRSGKQNLHVHSPSIGNLKIPRKACAALIFSLTVKAASTVYVYVLIRRQDN